MYPSGDKSAVSQMWLGERNGRCSPATALSEPYTLRTYTNTHKDIDIDINVHMYVPEWRQIGSFPDLIRGGKEML